MFLLLINMTVFFDGVCFFLSRRAPCRDAARRPAAAGVPLLHGLLQLSGGLAGAVRASLLEPPRPSSSVSPPPESTVGTTGRSCRPEIEVTSSLCPGPAEDMPRI